jgi:hypothetical protein
MPEYLLGSIVVHTPPAGSNISANDRLDIYYSVNTPGELGVQVVYKNNVLFVPDVDSDIGREKFNFKIVDGVSSYTGTRGFLSQEIQYAISSYSFCIADNVLVWFKMSISNPSPPYFKLQLTGNSMVCLFGGGLACDIHFVGPPLVVHTTHLTQPNGSIEVVAISSHSSVKYKLGEDFQYSTGGQTSGSFSNLGVGLHTIFAKDGYDCTIQISVFIYFIPEEQEHYRATWTTLSTGQGTPRTERIRIYEREYVGSVVEIEVGEMSPLFIQKPKQGDLNNKLTPIHPTNAELCFTSVYDNQFLPLFTQDNKKFRVVYEIDEGSGFAEVHQWFVAPSVFQSPFTPGLPHPVTISVGDNVKELETEKFTDGDDNLIRGRMKLIKIISHILQKTGLALKIRCGINIFEINHTIESDGSSDPLDQTYVDADCYRVENEAFTCWEVIEALLMPFGARIVQSNNQWLLEEIDRAFPSYDYRVFDVNGDYESNGTFNSIIDVKNPTDIDRAVLEGRGHSQEIIPSYGSISVISKLNYVGSLRGGFEKQDLLSPSSEKFSTSSGVFTSEEGFSGWSLRLNGTTGVSFGRTEIGIGRPGGTGRPDREGNPGHQRTPEVRNFITGDYRRSVGCFYFNPNGWSGNLRDAYVESSEIPYEYGPDSEIKLSFEYAAGGAGIGRWEFVVLRFVIKLGDDYLQQDGTWDSTECLYRIYTKGDTDLQKFEISAQPPPTDVVIDTTIQVRIYFFAKHFFDYGIPENPGDPGSGVEGEAGLRAFDTANEDNDYSADVRDVTGGRARRLFYELRRGVSTDDFPRRVRPDDYDAVTNAKHFELLKEITDNDELTNRSRGLDVKFYIDNVNVDTLINGQTPPETETIKLTITEYVREILEIELYNFDLPEITNAKNMYNNIFRLEDGTPTTTWARSGVDEQLPLQMILLKVLGANHSAPTFRLTGSFMNEFQRVGVANYLRLTKEGSAFSLGNTSFDIDLDEWIGDGDGVAFVWTADNSGSAEVTLTGAVNSERRYQLVEHNGGHIHVSASIHIEPDGFNDREDVLWLLFFKDGNVVHTEKLITFEALTTEDDFTISHITHFPKNMDGVGFYIKRVIGTGTCVYQFSEFGVEGVDIQEIYQISDYKYDARMNQGDFELMQMSKSYISLAGVDTGGNNQSGDDSGNSFNGDFNEDFGGAFDTIIN